MCVDVCTHTQLCPTLGDPMNYSPPGSSVPGIFPGKNTGLPFPTPEGLPNSGIKPMSLASPALAGRFFTTSATWDSLKCSESQGLSTAGSRYPAPAGLPHEDRHHLPSADMES